MNKLLLTIGLDKKGKKVTHDLFRETGFMISGMEGSGKTTFLKDLITQVSNKSRKDIKLLIACSKKKEFSEFINHPSLLSPIITNARDIKKQVKWIDKEKDLRYGILNESGKRSLAAYNKSAKKKMKPIIFFIDDYPFTLLEDKKFEELLFWIWALGRGVGIFIIFTVDGELFKNLERAWRTRTMVTSKLAFKLKTKRQSNNFLSQLGAEKLKLLEEALYEKDRKSVV